MDHINIIAMNQLQDASSQKEALLYLAIKKIVEVEALAMEKLSQKLPVSVMQNLRERILILKKNAANAYPFEEMLSFPLADLSQKWHSMPVEIREKSSDNILYRSKSQESEPALMTSDSDLNRLKNVRKVSFFSRAKALLGLEPSFITDTENYYPTLSFKQRGKTAGSAYLQRWEIRLNPILLAENSDVFVTEVIPHEYAHLLTFALYGRVQPHGREWQMMMTEIMGLPANRTHCFNTENSTTRRYERFTYTCLCQTHELTAIRHNRVQARKARYFCKHCGESLELQKS